MKIIERQFRILNSVDCQKLGCIKCRQVAERVVLLYFDLQVSRYPGLFLFTSAVTLVYAATL